MHNDRHEGCLPAALVSRMQGREEIEQIDRSRRLLHKKGDQVEYDDFHLLGRNSWLRASALGEDLWALLGSGAW